MKKRAAYIGISYPLLYDYGHPARKTKNDLSDSPNPIIESPLGLMILYDELLFLCRSICPNNMRDLPYVKFIDEMYPDFYFSAISSSAAENRGLITLNTVLTYGDIVESMNVTWRGVDTHTHGLQVGDITMSAYSSEERFLFDVYVFEALQQRYDKDIELIANIHFRSASFNSGTKAEFADRIIIQGIPNYISVDGPYHNCMEELRENKYISDFRRWIADHHSNLQRAEIDEMCNAVERNMKETQDRLFKRYLDANSGFSFFKSTSGTVLKTAAGVVCTPISIVDAFSSCIAKGGEMLKAKSMRWQGFVLESREIAEKIKR